MPKHISVSSIAAYSKPLGLKQAIRTAWDGERTHVVTWGHDAEQCAQAAVGGNRVKAALNWPADLQCESASTVRLKKRIKELEAELAIALDGMAEAVRRVQAAGTTILHT